MTLWTLIPIALLVTVYGAIGMIVARRPLIARLALREAIRRPRQSWLLVLGMMFGTAAILGMQGVNDTFTYVNTHLIYCAWGRTDITVSSRVGGQGVRDRGAEELASQGQFDVAQIVAPAIAIYAAVLLVTIGPALRASRLPASEALRIIG